MSSYLSPAQWNKPIMTIDLKKRRLRLYKHILRLLGDPDYVQFLVNPEKKCFLVRRGEETEPGSQKIYWTILNDNGQCCEFYSKPFVETLHSAFFDKDDEQTYRIIGDYHARRRFIAFDLEDSEPITYEPEALESSCKQNPNTDTEYTN